MCVDECIWVCVYKYIGSFTSTSTHTYKMNVFQHTHSQHTHIYTFINYILKVLCDKYVLMNVYIKNTHHEHIHIHSYKFIYVCQYECICYWHIITFMLFINHINIHFRKQHTSTQTKIYHSSMLKVCWCPCMLFVLIEYQCVDWVDHFDVCMCSCMKVCMMMNELYISVCWCVSCWLSIHS